MAPLGEAAARDGRRLAAGAPQLNELVRLVGRARARRPTADRQVRETSCLPAPRPHRQSPQPLDWAPDNRLDRLGDGGERAN